VKVTLWIHIVNIIQYFCLFSSKNIPKKNFLHNLVEYTLL